MTLLIIIIDGRWMLQVKAGLLSYAENLIKHLVKINSENEYLLFYGGGIRQRTQYPKIVDTPNLDIKLIRVPSRICRFLDHKWPIFPVEPWLGRYDVFHSPSFLAPLYLKRGVITIPDMIAFKFPHFYSPDLEFPKFLRRYLPKVAKQAKKIITISESSRRDILDILPLHPEKIVVTALAANERYKPITDAEIIRQTKSKYGISGEYICYLGTLEPRKNLPGLIKAHAKLRGKSLSHSLVLLGEKGWLYEDVFIAILNLKLGRNVIVPGYVPDEDLPALLSGADLFVYPSFYEGFGLPVLEAMSCGVPVITSNTSSLPEVTGDAAILVDPDDVDQLAGAMEKVLSDVSLKEELRRKGLERAKQFSWEKTAKETLRVYEEVAHL